MNLRPLTRYRSALHVESPRPSLEPRSAARAARKTFKLHWRQALDIGLLVIVLGAALEFTGRNLFHYPQYELDEGTYVGSAWTMVTRFKFFYYTYTYAHPPLGWAQIGVWSVLTGGFDRFGMSINSGRVFMLVITALCTFLVFRIVQVGTQRSSAAALAGLIFATSPLAISLHRQVYLDNIGTFWLLLSIFALQSANGRLGRIVLSAMSFGMAFLTKEVFAAMLPGMVFLAFTQSHRLQRRFATVLWTMTAVAGMSFFTLLALLKDELLPPGVLWSSSKPHVSLVSTYTHQAGRGGGGLFNIHGSFWKNVILWWTNDPILTLAGALALSISLLFWRRDRFTFGMAMLAGGFIVFLGRGGIVIYYYVIPLLPLAAIALGLVLGRILNYVSRWRPARSIAAPVILAAALVMTGSAWARNDLNFTVDDTSSQHAAAKWVANNLSPSSSVLMDSYAWQDLRGTAFTGGTPFTGANYYWPLLSDQGLVQKVLDDNWQKVDYLLISPNTEADARGDNLPLLAEALSRSDTIRTFSSGNWSQTILRVRKLHRILAPDDPILVRTWNGDKARFIAQGRVMNPLTHESTSQDQADAMLRAVYSNDRVTFDSVWKWTKTNLQVRGDGLLAAKWTGTSNKSGSVTIRDSMTEGDEDAALALLFAFKTWNDPSYQLDAMAIVKGIWERETVPTVSGQMAIAGSWARGETAAGKLEPVISLPALAPYAYRIFAEADPSHAWGELVDSTYALLGQIQSSPTFGGTVGLAPDAIKVDAVTGTLLHPGDTMAGTDAFTVNGSRLLWRLAIDYLWFKDARAKTAIDGLHFLRDKLQGADAHVMGGYTLDGAPSTKIESIAVSAGLVPSLLVTNDANLDFASTIFTTKILHGYTDIPSGVYWGKDPNDYGAQTWAWLTTAVMDGAISNLWAGQDLIAWNQVLSQKQ